MKNHDTTRDKLRDKGRKVRQMRSRAGEGEGRGARGKRKARRRGQKLKVGVALARLPCVRQEPCSLTRKWENQPLRVGYPRHGNHLCGLA